VQIDAFLADSVVTAEGKLFVQGAGWDNINTPGFPYAHDRIGIGMLVRVPYTDTNQDHRFAISLEDEDGQELPLADAPPGVESPDGKIRRIEGAFNVGRPPTLVAGDDQLIPMALNFNGLPLEHPGRYTFVVEIDGTEAKRLPFRVHQMQSFGPVSPQG